jgi:hypothetical protein
MKKLFGLIAISVALAAYGACTSTSNDAPPGKSKSDVTSSLAIPLVITDSDGNLYSVKGDITVIRTDVNPDEQVLPLLDEDGNPVDFSLSLNSSIQVAVPAGEYSVNLANWEVRNQDGVLLGTSADNDSVTLLAATLLVTVGPGQSIPAIFEFLIDGLAGTPTPDSDGGLCTNCCAYDADHDGFSNCSECPPAIFLDDPTQCPDTDCDGTPDYLDTNSDCDDILDCNEGDPGPNGTFVLSNEDRVDSVLCCTVEDGGNIIIGADITVTDVGAP